MIDLNPLNVLNQRQVKFLPVHFSKVKISDHALFDENLVSWVNYKLK
jgi:hypothetical protein